MNTTKTQEEMKLLQNFLHTIGKLKTMMRFNLQKLENLYPQKYGKNSPFRIIYIFDNDTDSFMNSHCKNNVSVHAMASYFPRFNTKTVFYNLK